MMLVGVWLFPATMEISIKVSQDLKTRHHLIYYVCAWSSVSEHTTQAPVHQYLLEHSWKYPNHGSNLDVHPLMNEKGECGTRTQWGFIQTQRRAREKQLMEGKIYLGSWYQGLQPIRGGDMGEAVGVFCWGCSQGKKPGSRRHRKPEAVL